MSHSLGIVIESLVAILLMFTIGYCMLLNKRLKRLKADEQSLKATIAELITATEIAERAIGGLKHTVRDVNENLGNQLTAADQLSEQLKRQLVEGDAVVDAERILDRDRGRRKSVVRRRGRQHDQIDRLRIDAGMVERGTRGIDRQMRGKLAVGGDMALPDAGALHDPLVGSIQPARQFGIGQDLPRQIGAAAEHDRTFRSHETASCAVCA